MNAKRIISACCLAVLFMLAACEGGSCGASDTPKAGVPEGKTDGPCRGDWNACDDPYTTCRRDVCRTCGEDGQRACPTYTSSTGPCRPGLTLEAGTFTCRSSCGSVGQPCCKAYGYGFECSGAASCNTALNKCEAKAPLCAAGSKTMSVTCVSSHGCAESVTRGYATTATYDEAKSCVQTAYSCASVTDKSVGSYKYCIHYPTKVASSLEVQAVDVAGALECAQWHAGSKSDGTPVEVTAGACPSI